MSSNLNNLSKYPALTKGDGQVFAKDVSLRLHNVILPKHGVDWIDTGRVYVPKTLLLDTAKIETYARF